MGDKYTIYIHCWKIYNLFVRALETSRKASFSSLFRSVGKLILYFPTMYIYCIFLVCLNGLYYKSFYHILCCNMFIFASPIIAKSQCWLFALRANIVALKYPYLPSYIHICPRIQLPVSVQWSQRSYVKVQGKMHSLSRVVVPATLHTSLSTLILQDFCKI